MSPYTSGQPFQVFELPGSDSPVLVISAFHTGIGNYTGTVNKNFIIK